MNIFLINHYAGSPEMGREYRPYYLAREWLNMGHNVTILAANNSHLRNYNPFFTSAILEEEVDGIKYIWVNTPKYNDNGLGRLKNIFSFVRKSLIMAKSFVNKYQPDVVIASSTYTSDNYIAKKISKLSGAKYIYEVHDLWPLSPKELGNMSNYHPFIWAMQHAEDFAYKNVDAVVSMLPKTKGHMQKHGLDITKWHFVPNGFVLDDWNNPEDLPNEIAKKIEEIKNNNKFIVGYTGGHAPSNSLKTLVDAAKLLKDDSSIHFLFVGSGIEKESLIKQANGLNNITFMNPIPKLSIPKLLEKMDVVVIGAIKSPLYRFGVSPNKLIDYMMAEKPIIQYIDAGNDIVKEANVGLSVPSGSPKKIVDAIKKLKQKSEEELKELGRNGKKYVLENHDYHILAERFIRIINEIKR